MKRKLKLHALPTEEVTHKGLWFDPVYKNWMIYEGITKAQRPKIPHCLYLTSDEEIKKSDKFIALSVNEVRTALAINGTQIIDEMKSSINKAHARKIVATDNPKLLWKKEVYNMSGLRENGIDWRTKIHNIPTSLIECFVEKQGKVGEVMVEYEAHNIGGGFGLAHKQPLQTTYHLLLNSSGEIIWSPVAEKKFTYTREELINLCKEYCEFVGSQERMSHILINEWFNKKFST